MKPRTRPKEVVVDTVEDRAIKHSIRVIEVSFGFQMPKWRIDYLAISSTVSMTVFEDAFVLIPRL